MKTRKLLVSLIALLLLAGLTACRQQTAQEKPRMESAPSSKSKGVNRPTPTGDYGKLLTVADVMKVTGMQGIETVPKDPSKSAGGDLNFSQSGEQGLVLMVNVVGAAQFDQWRAGREFFRDKIDGIGDEAYSGPASAPQPYNIYFRQGNTSVALASFFDAQKVKTGQMVPIVAMDQLKELAKIIAGRL